jgi:hypothetical protein
MKETSSFAAHLSAFLGPPVGCWPVDPNGHRMPFQIRAFAGGPVRRVVTYATAGLWKKPLSGREPGARVREELLLMVRDTPDAELLPGILLQVVAEALGEKRAWMPGDVIGPRGPLLPDAEAQALYVSAPSYLPDAFHLWRGPNGERVGVLWLVPITRAEAAFVRKHGSAAFEEVLVAEQPDLLNVMRTSVPLPMIVLGSRADESGDMHSVGSEQPSSVGREPTPVPVAEAPRTQPEAVGPVDDLTAESTYDGAPVDESGARLDLALMARSLAPPRMVGGAPSGESVDLSPPMMLDEGWDADGLGALADAESPAASGPSQAESAAPTSKKGRKRKSGS